MTVLLTTVFSQPEAQAAGFAFVYHAFNFLMLMVLGVIGLLRSGTTFSRVLAASRAFTDRGTTPNLPA
jgi:hypothetical protein